MNWKSWLLVFVSILSAALVLAYVLPSTKVDQSEADPAVTYFNSTLAKGSALQEGYFSFQGNDLHYLAAGDSARPAIVFIHGFPSYWYSFKTQIAHFQNTHRVIAIDGLGAGRSSAPTDVQPYSLQNMSKHILALMDNLKIERFHLVGHDWGAALSFAMAQAYPKRVITVTGISAPPFNGILSALVADQQQQTASSYIEKFKSANPILLKLLRVGSKVWQGAYRPLVDDGYLTAAEGELFRQATSNSRRINAHINWYRANLPVISEIDDDSYWPPQDTRISQPALFIWGDADVTLTAAAIEATRRIADQLIELELADEGHWPHVREAEQVNKAIATLVR